MGSSHQAENISTSDYLKSTLQQKIVTVLFRHVSLNEVSMPVPVLLAPKKSWVFRMASCSGRCREGAAALPNTNSKVSGICGVPGGDKTKTNAVGSPYEII